MSDIAIIQWSLSILDTLGPHVIEKLLNREAPLVKGQIRNYTWPSSNRGIAKRTHFSISFSSIEIYFVALTKL